MQTEEKVFFPVGALLVGVSPTRPNALYFYIVKGHTKGGAPRTLMLKTRIARTLENNPSACREEVEPDLDTTELGRAYWKNAHWSSKNHAWQHKVHEEAFLLDLYNPEETYTTSSYY